MKTLQEVKKAIEVCLSGGIPQRCVNCPYHNDGCDREKMKDAYTYLERFENLHRLLVHNTGNVDIPVWMTASQFYEFMDSVVEAIEHAEKGESWPYEGAGEE